MHSGGVRCWSCECSLREANSSSQELGEFSLRALAAPVDFLLSQPREMLHGPAWEFWGCGIQSGTSRNLSCLSSGSMGLWNQRKELWDSQNLIFTFSLTSFQPLILYKKRIFQSILSWFLCVWTSWRCPPDLHHVLRLLLIVPNSEWRGCLAWGELHSWEGKGN